tara:strand:- start:1154 stop:2239 length:1086 start_codon:yes stop_codon:yes gene_type:complete
MPKIKAAVAYEFGKPLKVEDVILRSPVNNEVEVTLGAVAICHSDISYMEGAWGGFLPAVYGHEASGKISNIGDNVEGLAIGDRVVVTLIRSCGNCTNCKQGQPTICMTEYDGTNGPLKTSRGGTLMQAMACGAFAEKVVVDKSQIVKVSSKISYEAAALMACGVITGIGAVVNAAKIKPGQDVIIIGAGGVGLNAIQGARLAGARRIIAVDLSEEKLNIAIEFGATDGILGTKGSPWKLAKEKLGRGADAVFVSVGAVSVYDTAPLYLAQGGQVVMLGMTKTNELATFKPVNLAAASQKLVGSKMGDTVIERDIPWIADLYLQNRLKLDELISKKWKLDQINEAIFDTKSGSAKRNLIVFN